MTVCRVIGLPEAAHSHFAQWSHAIANLLTSDHDARVRQEGADALVAQNALVESSLATAPSDSLLAALLSAETSGLITREETIATGSLIIYAGFETSATFLSRLLYERARSPSRFELAGGGENDDYIEDALLAHPAVPHVARIAVSPISLGGVDIPEGSLVIIMIEGGRVATGPEKHMTFGYGAHYCLGASIVRIEANRLLTHLAQHWPKSRLAGEARFIRVQTQRVLAALPLVLAK